MRSTAMVMDEKKVAAFTHSAFEQHHNLLEYVPSEVIEEMVRAAAEKPDRWGPTTVFIEGDAVLTEHIILAWRGKFLNVILPWDWSPAEQHLGRERDLSP